MAGRTLDVETLIAPHLLAKEISSNWQEWSNARSQWITSVKETRNYVYATDTTTTSNKTLPWANSTTTPKLCQLYDNLKANYSYALFPQSQWHKWKGNDPESKEKAKYVQAYMNDRLYGSGFEKTVDRLVDDWVLTGNCFATVEYVSDYTTLPSGEVVPNYVGPRLVRISPYDIVFNPIAANFSEAPKIIRSLYTLGEIHKMVEDGDESKKEVFTKILENRSKVGESRDRLDKDDGFIADGFSSLSEYYNSGLVEILTFYGDIYDQDNNEFKPNREVVVLDRAYVIKDEPVASWLGTAPVFHSSWRSRPDNLYGMGPLDNLVGMQYRIDHLENLKADVFDQVAFPILKVKGSVEEFEQKPGERIYMGEEGDVAYLNVDVTALNADMQISILEQKMEEFAGAPRQAMGFRTPGEKTAFEVQTLENAGSRIFNNKAAKLEKEFIEPILNAMLEAARRNAMQATRVESVDERSGSSMFLEITMDDLQGEGRIIPVGARHFAERAQRLQNISQFTQIKAQDQSIGVHISGKRIAELMAEEMNEPELYKPNVAIEEQVETQQVAQDVQTDAMEQEQVKMENGL